MTAGVLSRTNFRPRPRAGPSRAAAEMLPDSRWPPQPASQIWRPVKAPALIAASNRIAFRVGLRQTRCSRAVGAVNENQGEERCLVEVCGPERRHWRSKGVIAVPGREDHVLLGPCQLDAKAVPLPDLLSCYRRGSRFRPSAPRVGLDKPTVAEPIVEDDRVAINWLRQPVSHDAAVELAGGDICFGQTLGPGV